MTGDDCLHGCLFFQLEDPRDKEIQRNGHLGVRVVELVSQFSLCVKRVVHDYYAPKLEDRLDSDKPLRDVGEQNGHLVSLLNAQVGQGSSKPIDQVVQLPVTDLLSHHDQGGIVREVSCCPLQGLRHGDLFIIDAGGNPRGISLVPEPLFHTSPSHSK